MADDNQTVRLVLEKALNLEGFDCLHAPNGHSVLKLLEETTPDVVVMNAWLPGLSGLDLCQSLRGSSQFSSIPIILLISETLERDRLQGLERGADDCLSMPLPPVELAARVKNLLRRLNPTAMPHMLKVGHLMLDKESRRVHRKNAEVRLGPTEFKLLACLMGSPGRVFSRQELAHSIWGAKGMVGEHAIDVHIARLRKKIDAGKSDSAIRAVRGVGYALKKA
ncbi:MAG: winged helix-turn-helix domain-containing protein [Rhizobium sp.]|nr:winged helix-turn-helix domain-containing protein [Rhizobium sp.]